MAWNLTVLKQKCLWLETNENRKINIEISHKTIDLTKYFKSFTIIVSFPAAISFEATGINFPHMAAHNAATAIWG